MVMKTSIAAGLEDLLRRIRPFKIVLNSLTLTCRCHYKKVFEIDINSLRCNSHTSIQTAYIIFVLKFEKIFFNRKTIENNMKFSFAKKQCL